LKDVVERRRRSSTQTRHKFENIRKKPGMFSSVKDINAQHEDTVMVWVK